MAFAIANLFYFIFFNKKDIKNRAKWLLKGTSAIITVYLLTAFFIEYEKLIPDTIGFILLLVAAHLLIFGHIAVLFSVNHIIQKIPIVHGYFNYTMIFSVLSIFATFLYTPVYFFIFFLFTLDYRL